MIAKQIQKMQDEWLLLQPLAADCAKRLKEKFRLEFNYNSNHLEGNTLTYGETKLLILFDETKGKHEFREYAEMKAHDVALAMIEEEATDKERPLTEAFIRRLNETILVSPFWKEAETADGQSTRKLITIGEYKKTPNHVRLANGEIFEYATPEETPALMAELIAWYREEEKKAELSPVTLAALLHYRYICIHPFDDGNGRVARLLVNYVMFKNNLPPIIIKTDDKKNYLRALHQADAGDIKAFTDYMAQQLLWSLDISIRAAKGESIDEPDDWEKKLTLLKKEVAENPDEKVTIKYSPYALKLVINESLMPLLSILDEKLKSFDTLLLSRDISFRFNSHRRELNAFKQNDIMSINFIEKFPELEETREIEAVMRSGGLRSNKGKSFQLKLFLIDFYDNVYEIDDYRGNQISKLYSSKLSDDEIKSIVSSIGTAFYNEVEKIISGSKS